MHLRCSIMAPLIAEYDRHMDEMTEQLQRYQVKQLKLNVYGGIKYYPNIMNVWTLSINILLRYAEIMGLICKDLELCLIEYLNSL